MGLRFPKVGKRMRTQRQIDAALDRTESAQVKIRSGGQCEVRWFGETGRIEYRCQHVATQVHHMIGGHGRRARGLSVYATAKQHVCDACHLAITGDLGGKKLRRIGGPVPHYQDVYERCR